MEHSVNFFSQLLCKAFLPLMFYSYCPLDHWYLITILGHLVSFVCCCPLKQLKNHLICFFFETFSFYIIFSPLEVKEQAFSSTPREILEWDFASKLVQISLKYTELYLLVYFADGLLICCFTSAHWMGRELPYAGRPLWNGGN